MVPRQHGEGLQCHAANFSVMRGLDPRIHDEVPQLQALLFSLLRFIMDCRSSAAMTA
jgi:hypothetical protein